MTDVGLEAIGRLREGLMMEDGLILERGETDVSLMTVTTPIVA